MSFDRDKKGRFLKGIIPWSKGKKGIRLSPKSEFKKGVSNNVMEKNPNWKEGKIITSTGYISIKNKTHPNSDKQGYVPEHRLVIEKSIGRHLSKKEIVHHINGDRKDNRIENLQLFSSKKEHMIEHNKQKFQDMLRNSKDEIIIEELTKRGYKIQEANK